MTKPLLPGTTPPLQLSTSSARIECACAAENNNLSQSLDSHFWILQVFSDFEDFSKVLYQVFIILNRFSFT